MEAQQNNPIQMNVGGNSQMPQQQQPQFNANAETNAFGQGGQNTQQQQMPQNQSQPSDANAVTDGGNFEEGGEINNNDKLILNWGLVFTFFK